EPDIVTRTCEICFEAKPQLNDFPAFSRCKHPPASCRLCILKHLRWRLMSFRDWRTFTCPSCGLLTSVPELKVALGERVSGYIDNWIKYSGSWRQGTWQGCPEINCKFSGKVRKGSKARLKCPKCGAESCFNHQDLWHTSMTCRQYDIQMPAEEKMSQLFLDKNTKRCPECHVRALKPEHCDTGVCK
ncbi:hypothetical protein A1O1_03555, partial [Capronia coronata CBS 617.96]